MQAPVPHKIGQQTFWLSPHRAAFWEEQKALILSDLHFGKTGHFRKAGIAVPQQVYKEDLQRLVSLLQYFNPRQIIAVGDLFHSLANLELDWFKRWRNDFSSLEFNLVKGNHDILKEQWYKEINISFWEKELIVDGIRFTHDYCKDDPVDYTFCGHLHPGVILNGLGKQSLRFPCFYFSEGHCILPAFSKFTGMATLEPSPSDVVYAIVEKSLIKLR